MFFRPQNIIYSLITILLLAACATMEVENHSNKIAPALNKQDYNDIISIKQTNDELDFLDYLCGINSVIVITDQEFEITFENDSEFYRKYHKLIREYFEGIGIQNIAITRNEQDWLETNIPIEQITYFRLSVNNSKNYITEISESFKTCNGDEFQLTTETDYYVDNNWDTFLKDRMKSMFWANVNYDPNCSLVPRKNITNWNRQKIIEHLNNNRADEIEGIYEKYGHGRSEYDNRYSIAVLKEDDSYNIIYLDGARNKYNWQEGELKGTISQTSIKDFYKVNWVMADKSLNHNVYLSTSKYNFLEFDFLDSDIGFKINYLKMYPQITENRVSSDEYFSSGTGFLISDQGYLVTNHHIVGNSSKITVQFKNEEPQTQYNAEIILNDKKNDITILRLKDFNVTQNQNINLNICNTDAPIGTSVFTLGYPMIETMGEAVKLSDGIISSHSGYMANENIYQITVPINPGNSGGPLFDKSGNLVGIINAKYTGAENVSYAIKSSLLCDMIGDKIELSNNKSPLSEKSFVDQVEILNNLVCLIKVYN